MRRHLYRAVLHAYPAAFRRRFGQDMEDLFRDRLAQARRQGRWTALRITARLLADAVLHGLDERRRGGAPERGHMLQALGHDVRYSIRAFATRPAFTAVALVTLALGIGANTAIFSLVHAALLRDLPFHEPDRIVRIYEMHRRFGFNRGVANPFNFDQWERHTTSFSHLAAMRPASLTLTGAGDPERLSGQTVTSAFFDVMGVQPSLGRPFSQDEAERGENVALLSHALWRSRFGGDDAVIESHIMLEGTRSRVIGVMPAGFSFPNETQVWQPLHLTPQVRAEMSSWYLGVVARLDADASIAAAQAELDTISRRLEEQFPKQRAERGAWVIGLHEDLVVRIADGLKLLQGVVAFVLLIACANVANLLLAQATARQRELGIRAAVGAGRGRLIRQLLTESVLLSLAGAALGTLVAIWGVKALVAMSPQTLPEGMTASVSGAALGFTAGLAALTALIFGIVPALLTARGDVVDTLRDGGRGSSPRRGRFARSALVAAEVALAIVLLAGAGLLVRSFVKLTGQELGFRRDGVLTADIRLPVSSYPDNEARARFWDALLPRLEQVPGVAAVTGSTALPFSMWEWQTAFQVEGREDVPNRGVAIRTITSGYFSILSIPLHAGREFSPRDSATSEPVMVVNEAFAQKHLAGLDPLGQRINTSPSAPASAAGRRGASLGPSTASWSTVVGVVGNSRHLRLEEDPQPEVYRPLAQAPSWSLTLAIRTDNSPEALAPALRAAVAEIDPNLPVQQIATMRDLVEKSVATRRFYMSLLSLFAAVALALAACGIYGVMSFSVSQRVRELAIRLALGAQPSRLKQRLIADGLRPIAAGIAIGVPASLALTKLLESQLFLTSPRDPLTLAIVCLTLVAAGTAAGWLPARRTARVDPLDVLRSE